MKIKRRDALQLWSYFVENAKEKMDAKVSFCFFTNKKILDNLVKEVKEVQNSQKEKLSKDFFEYETKRINLCKQYADKDEEENPIIKYDSVLNKKEFLISKENQKDFLDNFFELQKEYKEELDFVDKLKVDFNDYLQEEIEIKLNSLNIDSLPKNISLADIEILSPILVI